MRCHPGSASIDGRSSILGGSYAADGTETSPLKARFEQLAPQAVSMKVRSIALALGAFGMLTGCVSHEDHIKSDAEICRVLGHAEGTHDYGTCMRALNKRRCEDRSNRDPVCQYAGAK